MKGGSQVIQRESLIDIHYNVASNGRRDSAERQKKRMSGYMLTNNANQPRIL